VDFSEEKLKLGDKSESEQSFGQ